MHMHKVGPMSGIGLCWGGGVLMEDSMRPGIMVDGSSIAGAMRPEGRQGDGGIEGESRHSPTLC